MNLSFLQSGEFRENNKLCRLNEKLVAYFLKTYYKFRNLILHKNVECVSLFLK